MLYIHICRCQKIEQKNASSKITIKHADGHVIEVSLTDDDVEAIMGNKFNNYCAQEVWNIYPKNECGIKLSSLV